VANLNTQYLNSQAGTYYLDCANFTGVLANARVQQSNVTQHEAALSIAAGSQLTGTLADGTVAQSNVTQHEGALVLAYTQLSFSGLTIGHVWRATSATTAGFGTISNAGFADNTIAHARLVNISQNQVLGRTAVGGGAVSAIATSALTGLDTGGITTGTFVKARLPSATAYEDEANTFTLTQAFNHATTAFTLTDTSVITNLNADRLDSQHGSYYRDASNLNAGTLLDARVSAGNVTQHSGAVFSAETVSAVGDVTITTIGAGELLKWSGTAWINNTLAEAGIPSLPINASDVEAGTFADASTYTFSARLDVGGDAVVGGADPGGGSRLRLTVSDGNLLRLDNSAATNLAWEMQLTSGGVLEFRSVQDNGTTVLTAMQIAHATANVTLAAQTVTMNRAVAHTIHMDSTGNDAHTLSADSNRTTGNSDLLRLGAQWNGDEVARIAFRSGSDTTNKDDGKIFLQTQPDSATGLLTRMIVDQNGITTVQRGADEVLSVNQTSATGSPFISFQQNYTQRSFIQHSDSGDTMIVASEYGALQLKTGVSGTDLRRLHIDSSGNISVGTSDPGGGGSPAAILRVNGTVIQNSASWLARTLTSWSDGAGAATGTLTNAPAATNPSKWIPVDDNGTTRYVPAW
jgi:hypothetical protein